MASESPADRAAIAHWPVCVRACAAGVPPSWDLRPDRCPDLARRVSRWGPLAAHAGHAGAHDRLGPVAHLELREDVGDVVAHGLGARTSSAVISPFDRPAATMSRISRSRSVSSGNAAGSGRGAGREKYAVSRRATPGPKIASPAATALTARSSSARWAPLSRYPRAPARTAANTVSSSSCIVSTSTATCGAASTMRRVASTPSMPGMLMSISTTSGWSERAAATAASPESASPTTTTSLAVSSSARSPARNAGWSSATSTRWRRRRGPRARRSCGPRLFERQPRHDARPATRPALDRDVAAELLRPLPHRLEAGARAERRRQAPAVVGDLDRELGRGLEPDAAQPGARRAGPRSSSPRRRSGRRPPRRPRAVRASGRGRTRPGWPRRRARGGPWRRRGEPPAGRWRP